MKKKQEKKKKSLKEQLKLVEGRMPSPEQEEFREGVILRHYYDNADLFHNQVLQDLLVENIIADIPDYASFDLSKNLADLFKELQKKAETEGWVQQKRDAHFFCLALVYSLHNLVPTRVLRFLFDSQLVKYFSLSSLVQNEYALRQETPAALKDVRKKVLRNISLVVRQFTSQLKDLDGFPTIEEAADHLKLSVQEVESIMNWVKRKRKGEFRTINNRKCIDLRRLG